MIKAYCPNCNESIKIKNDNDIECPDCFNIALENIEKEETENSTVIIEKSSLKIKELELTYQKTFEKITIPKSNVILGREYIGCELFNKILLNGKPVISRKHCSIEFDNAISKFTIIDLGSKNHTFFNDKECLEKIVIENNGIIILGREPFLVKYLYVEDESNKEEDVSQDIKSVPEPESKQIFFCPDCSNNFEEDGYCPECDVKLKKD